MNYFGDLGGLSPDYVSYSLEGEDRIALSILRNALSIFPKEKLFYLDIGCNQPMAGNNTYLFYNLGFRGFCIDPLPDYSQIYSSLRPRDVFVNTAVSSSPRQQQFVRFADDAASTCHEETLMRYKQKFLVESEYTITSRTIDDIIYYETSGSPMTIPLVSLDIEGGELEVIEFMLKSSIHNYELFIVEEKFFNLTQATSKGGLLFDLLLSNGYSLIARTPLNSFYVRKKSEYFAWIPESML